MSVGERRIAMRAARAISRACKDFRLLSQVTRDEFNAARSGKELPLWIEVEMLADELRNAAQFSHAD